MGHYFFTLMIFNNQLKAFFSLRNILVTTCVKCVRIVIRYILLEKQAFNGLLKVIEYLFFTQIFFGECN